MNSLRDSVIAIFSGRVTRIILTLVFTPILVRLLTQEEYGVYAFLMAVIGIVTVVTPLGLFDSVRKHVAEHEERSDEETGIILVAIVLSTLYSIALVSLFVVSNRIFEVVPSQFIHLIVVVLLANNLFQVFRGVFYGRRREQVAELFTTGRRGLYVVVALGAAYYGFGVVGVITAYTLALVVATVVLLGATVSTVHLRTRPRSGLADYARPVSRYGLVQAVGGVAAVALYKTDILLVEYFRGPTETALYQAALLPAEYVWFVPIAIQMALLQNAAHHWARDSVEQIDRNVTQGLTYAILALILFGVGLFVLAEEFVTVYFGPAYEASALPLQILVVGTVFFGINRVLVPVLQATGRLRYTEGLTLLALFVNVVLNVILIPRYGIQGAAVATAISYAFMFVGGLVIWQQTEFTLLYSTELLRLFAVFVGFGVSFWIVVNQVSLSPIATLVVFPPVGFGIFLFIILAFRVVTIPQLRSVFSINSR